MARANETIERLLAEVLQLPVTDVTDDLLMKNVDVWDSLKHMELIVSLETAFGRQFTFDEIVVMQSVREIKRVLEGKGGQG